MRMGTVARGVGLTDRRKFADGVADIHLGVAIKLFCTDHGNQGGRCIALDVDARGGDFNGFRLLTVLCLRGRRYGRHHGSHRAAQHQFLAEIFHSAPRAVFLFCVKASF
jgi:hypothetical protein